MATPSPSTLDTYIDHRSTLPHENKGKTFFPMLSAGPNLRTKTELQTRSIVARAEGEKRKKGKTTACLISALQSYDPQLHIKELVS